LFTEALPSVSTQIRYQRIVGDTFASSDSQKVKYNQNPAGFSNFEYGWGSQQILLLLLWQASQ